MKFKNVIVTGGAGFIGSHLVDALVPLCERVISIDEKKPSKEWKNPDAVYKTMDIRDDGLLDIFKKEKPDVVFHLAAHIHDRESVHEPVLNAQYNIVGSIKVFEAARKYAKKIVFTSTGVVYGEQEALPLKITTTPLPVTPYAISKLAGERYLAFYDRVYNIPTVALRMGNVYGPRQDNSAESGAIGIFAARFLKGEQVFVNNDGKTTRDYVFVGDVVEALLTAALTKARGIFNVGTGQGTETGRLFELVATAVGVQTRPDFREEVPDFPKHIVLDISETVKRLGWKPEVTLEEGLEKTVDWYRDHV